MEGINIKSTETWRQEESGTLDIKKEFCEEDCPIVSLLNNSGEETGTLHIKKEFPEEHCSTVSLHDPREDTGTLDVKKEFSEENCSTVTKKECSEENCSTVTLPDKSRKDTKTLDFKKEFSEEDCSTFTLPDKSREGTGTLDIKKEFSEEYCSIVTLPNKSREDTGILDIKKEFSEEDCSTVTLPDKVREDTGTFDIKKEFSEEDCPTVSLLDDSGEETDALNIKKELSDEDCPTVSLLNNSGEETGTLDIKNEFSEKDYPTVSLLDDSDEDIGKLDIKKEFPGENYSMVVASQENCSKDPVTPIMSCVDNPVDSGAVDMKVEISEPDCFTASSTSIPRTDKPEDTGNKLADKIQCAKKRATFISTPIIYLPDNLVEDINKFDIKVTFPDQDWSTVPSTPKIFLPGQKNASGTSKINSKRTNNIPAKGIAPSIKKKTVPIRKNVCVPLKTPLRKKKKLSCRSKRKRDALIAHGIPEEIAKALCVLPLPSLMEMFPDALNAINPTQESQTPVTNAPKSTVTSADKPSCMEPAQKNVPTSITNEQRTVNSKNTALRVGIQDAKPMDKAQMTMVHRCLISSITEVGKGGCGPGFLNFQQMDGWIMVTCVDQRSRAWLVNKLKYLDLWPSAQLSIMPEQTFSKQAVNKVIAFIPESEATNVQEALTLLKAQNKGLNTQHWKLLNERLEIGKSWSILFIIDEPSLETLTAKNCQAAIGFKRMRFRIITASSVPINNAKSQFSKNQSQTSSQSSKGNSQKPPFSLAAGHEIPVGPGVGTNPVGSQNLISQDTSQFAQSEKGRGAVTQRGASSNSETANKKSDGKNNSFAQSSRPKLSKEPSTLAATSRPIPRVGGDLQLVIEDSRTDISSQGGTGRDKPKILGIEHILQTAKDSIEEIRQKQKTQTREYILNAARDRIQQIRQNSQTETPTSQQNRSQSVTTSRWDEAPTQTGRKRPLEARDRDTARPIFDYSKGRREETSTSILKEKLPAARDPNKATKTNDRHGYIGSRERIETGRFRDINEAQRISQGSQGIGRDSFVQDKMANGIVTDRVEFSSQTTSGNSMMPPTFVTSGVDAPSVVTLGRSVTGDITVTQLNEVSGPTTAGSGMTTNYNGFFTQTINGNLTMAPSGYSVPTTGIMGSSGTGAFTAQQIEFSAQTTGGNIAMAPPMLIPGYCASSVVNLAINGTEGITVTPQNIPMMPQSMVVPGYGAPTVVNLSTGAGGITVPSQNQFSALGSEIQAMDYFLGPGGGSQFVQNQTVFQNSLSYGGAASQQTALATMCPNQQNYMNCYQAPQNGMSSYNQDNSQKSSVFPQMPMDNEESEASRDSDASRSGGSSEEGFYRSWIIQDADSFAASTARHSALNAATGQMSQQSTSRYEGDVHGISTFAQDSSRSYSDTHSRSFKELLSPQGRDHKDPYYRNSPSMSNRRFDLRSPQGRSSRVRDAENENYESSPIKEERGDSNRLLKKDRSRSPRARSGYSAWIIEDVENYGRNRNSREETDDRDIPLRPDRTQHAGSKGGNSNWAIQDAERRNSREKGDDRDRPPRQERNDYRGLVKEDGRSCDKSRSSGRERDRDRLRSDRRSPQKSVYERREQDTKRYRSGDPVTWESSNKAQRPRERDGYIRNRRDGLPREPGYQRDRRHEERPRR